ncbi:MAG: acyltransferase [Bacteroides sp.]|nr:acyltransferase [Bacteroides sp.]
MVSYRTLKHALGRLWHYYIKPQTCEFGKIGTNSVVGIPADLKCPKNIFIGNNSRIGPRSTILTVRDGKFIYGNNNGAAEGLVVIASNHKQKVGVFRTGSNTDNIYRDVVVEDDVWIGINVTLLPGTHISRGCIVGASSVCAGYYPPYSVVVGNPAKVVKFKFSIDDIIKHEKLLYPIEERKQRSELVDIFEAYPEAAERKPYSN